MLKKFIQQNLFFYNQQAYYIRHVNRDDKQKLNNRSRFANDDLRKNHDRAF